MPAFLLLLLVFPSLIHAQTVITVPGKDELLPLSSGLALMVDKSGEISIGEVLAGEHHFAPTKFPFSGGYTKSAHWFRFVLQREEGSPTDWLLAAAPAYIDSLQLYSPSGDSGYVMMQVGDQVAASSRPDSLRYGLNTFTISLQDTSPHIFYLRLQTHSTSALNLKLATPEALAQFNSRQKMVTGFILGVLLLLSLNAIMLWAWLRRLAELYVVGYILGAVLVQITIDGLIPQYLFPGSPAIVDMLAPIGGTFQAGFLTLFFISFYDARRNFPRLNYLFLAVVVFSVVTLVSIAFDGYVLVAPYLYLVMLVMLPCFIYVTWQGIKLKLLGSRAIFYGHLIFAVIGGFNLLLITTDLIPSYPILLESTHIGSVVFVIFMLQGLYMQLRAVEIEKRDTEIRAKAAEESAAKEQQMRQDQSTFMTMLTHEFRTPLSVIDSAIQTMALSTGTLHSSVSERHERIKQSVSHLNALLENTLIAENADKNPLRPHLETVSLRPLISTILQRILPDERHCDLSVSDDAQCMADPHLLDLAISNLVVNALKYSPEGADVSLRVDGAQRQEGAGTILTITNRYASSDRPDSSKWLDKYYREADKSNINGFGLGLYLVQEIMRAHNGEIRVNVTQMNTQWLVSVSITFPAVNPKSDTKTA